MQSADSGPDASQATDDKEPAAMAGSTDETTPADTAKTQQRPPHSKHTVPRPRPAPTSPAVAAAHTAKSAGPVATDPPTQGVTAIESDPSHPLDEGGCWVCKGNDEQHLILLCDGCEGEYHTFCHSPRVKEIPQGDWFCARCVAAGRDKLTTAKKNVADDARKAAEARKKAVQKSPASPTAPPKSR